MQRVFSGPRLDNSIRGTTSKRCGSDVDIGISSHDGRRGRIVHGGGGLIFQSAISCVGEQRGRGIKHFSAAIGAKVKREFARSSTKELTYCLEDEVGELEG